MREGFTSLLPATPLLASFEKDDVLLVLRIWILLVDIELLFNAMALANLLQNALTNCRARILTRKLS